jgi:hypothetical protein
MRVFRITAGALAAAAAIGAWSSQARADIIDITQPNVHLSAVLGNQFIVGDKIFTVAANGFASSRFSASNITISALNGASPGFRLSGAFNDTPGDATGSEFVLSFNVAIRPEFLAQGFRLSGVTATFDGAAGGSGSFSRVDETVLNGSNNQLLANGSVFAMGNGATHLTDTSSFGPPGFTSFNIVKDVQFFANGANGSATASFVDQLFNQIGGSSIPLPSGAGMALVGMSILAVRRRRN